MLMCTARPRYQCTLPYEYIAPAKSGQGPGGGVCVLLFVKDGNNEFGSKRAPPTIPVTHSDKMRPSGTTAVHAQTVECSPSRFRVFPELTIVPVCLFTHGMARPLHMCYDFDAGGRGERKQIFVALQSPTPYLGLVSKTALCGGGAGCVVEGGAWLLGAHSASIEGEEGGATHVLPGLCAKSLTTGEEGTGRQKGLRPVTVVARMPCPS